MPKTLRDFLLLTTYHTRCLPMIVHLPMKETR